MRVCRGCKGVDLRKVVDLGKSPLANNFLEKNDIGKDEKFYPLELYFCENCKLVQLGFVVPAEEMYTNYLYVPSSSPTFVEHFSGLANELASKFSLSDSNLVVDIGGNDGTFLKHLKNMGMRVLNVEPAKNIADIAIKNGVETINDYFTRTSAGKICDTYGNAKVIVATNVFTHVDNLDDLIYGVKELLSDDGVFVIEIYYMGDIIKKSSFDLIYHEHLSYFTLLSSMELFKRFGMTVFDVQRISMHGGSLRIFVCKDLKYKIASNVEDILRLEKKDGLDRIETYISFGKSLDELRTKLVKLIGEIKSKGNRIAGYGAPAKSTTLLNYFGIGKDYIDYIVDKNPLKQNRYTPGMHIPIFSTKKLSKNKPDYLIIFAWNVAEEIIKQEDIYRKSGGKFIIPVPEPKIVE